MNILKFMAKTTRQFSQYLYYGTFFGISAIVHYYFCFYYQIEWRGVDVNLEVGEEKQIMATIVFEKCVEKKKDVDSYPASNIAIYNATAGKGENEWDIRLKGVSAGALRDYVKEFSDQEMEFVRSVRLVPSGQAHALAAYSAGGIEKGMALRFIADGPIKVEIQKLESEERYPFSVVKVRLEITSRRIQIPKEAIEQLVKAAQQPEQPPEEQPKPPEQQPPEQQPKPPEEQPKPPEPEKFRDNLEIKEKEEWLMARTEELKKKEQELEVMKKQLQKEAEEQRQAQQQQWQEMQQDLKAERERQQQEHREKMEEMERKLSEQMKQNEQKLNEQMKKNREEMDEQKQDLQQEREQQQKKFERQMEEVKRERQELAQQKDDLDRQKRELLNVKQQNEAELQRIKDEVKKQKEADRKEIEEEREKLRRQSEEIQNRQSRWEKEQKEWQKEITAKQDELEQKLDDAAKERERLMREREKLGKNGQNTGKAQEIARQEREIIDEQWSEMEKLHPTNLSQHQSYNQRFSTTVKDGVAVPGLDFSTDRNFVGNLHDIMKFHKMEIMAYPSSTEYYISADLRSPSSSRYRKRTDFEHLQNNFAKRTIGIESILDNVVDEIERGNLYRGQDGRLYLSLIYPHGTDKYLAWKSVTVCKKYGYEPEAVSICRARFQRSKTGYWSLIVEGLILKNGQYVPVEDYEKDW